jgi:hypothetical protein
MLMVAVAIAAVRWLWMRRHAAGGHRGSAGIDGCSVSFPVGNGEHRKAIGIQPISSAIRIPSRVSYCHVAALVLPYPTIKTFSSAGTSAADHGQHGSGYSITS